jgi:hypothetical protein
MVVVGVVVSACFMLFLHLIMSKFSIHWNGYGSELPWLTEMIENCFSYLIIFPAGFALMLGEYNEEISLNFWYRVMFWGLTILFSGTVLLVYFGMNLPGYYSSVFEKG